MMLSQGKPEALVNSLTNIFGEQLLTVPVKVLQPISGNSAFSADR